MEPEGRGPLDSHLQLQGPVKKEITWLRAARLVSGSFWLNLTGMGRSDLSMPRPPLPQPWAGGSPWAFSFSKGARARRPLSRKFSLTGGKGQVCGYVVGKQLNLVTSSSAALCAWGGTGGRGSCPHRSPPLAPLDKWGLCTCTFMVLSGLLRPPTPLLGLPLLLA